MISFTRAADLSCLVGAVLALVGVAVNVARHGTLEPLSGAFSHLSQEESESALAQLGQATIAASDRERAVLVLRAREDESQAVRSALIEIAQSWVRDSRMQALWWALALALFALLRTELKRQQRRRELDSTASPRQGA